MRRVLAAALGLVASCAAPAADVLHPLDRPALETRHAARSVLLDVTFAGPRAIAVGERGIVVLSDDGGATWRQAQVPVSVSLTKVAFVDARRGWAVGHYGVVLHSQDGGQTWQRQLDGRTAAAIALAAMDKKAPQSAADAPPQLREARRWVAEGADEPFLDLHFEDERNGFVVGAHNLAFRTRDGGRTWEYWSDRIDNPEGLHLYAVGRSGNYTYVAGEQGLFLRSTDGGETFARLPTPGKASWFASAEPASGAIMLAGLRGRAIRSSDGGATWTTLPSDDAASFVAAAHDGARVVLVDQAGNLYSGDAATLQRVRAPPVRAPTGVAVAPGGGMLVSGAQGVTRIAP